MGLLLSGGLVAVQTNDNRVAPDQPWMMWKGVSLAPRTAGVNGKGDSTVDVHDAEIARCRESNQRRADRTLFDFKPWISLKESTIQARPAS
jgi:hypothetical protein